MLALLALTFMVNSAILGTALYRYWTHKPVINLPPITVVVEGITVDVSKAIPTPLVVQVIPLTNEKVVDAAKGEAMPEDIVEYCEEESEPLVAEQRKRRARSLKAELGSWEAAMRALRREDTPPDE